MSVQAQLILNFRTDFSNKLLDLCLHDSFEWSQSTIYILYISSIRLLMIKLRSELNIKDSWAINNDHNLEIDTVYKLFTG